MSARLIHLATRNTNQNITEFEEDNDQSMEIGEYKCDFCLEYFSSEELLMHHVQTHNPALVHSCQDCGEGFENYAEKKNHNCIQKFTCQYCGDILESKLLKKKHEQEHYDQRHGHSCDTCGKKFIHGNTLDLHRKMHHPEMLKQFSCLHCPRKFKHKTKLDHHVRSVHTFRQTHTCQQCNSTFRDPQSLRQHEISKHPPIHNRIACSKCTKLVPVHSMKKHLREHEVTSNRVPFICEECNKAFASEIILKHHIEKSHELKKCPNCDFFYSSYYLFKKHRMLVHGNIEGVFTCGCSKTFVTQTDLKRHLASHFEERLHNCNICDQNFKSQKHLTQHTRSLHENKRPYKCKFCSCTFNQVSNRIRHESTHSEEKSHSCSVCGRSFKHLYNKSRHEKVHENLGGLESEKIVGGNGSGDGELVESNSRVASSHSSQH